MRPLRAPLAHALTLFVALFALPGAALATTPLDLGPGSHARIATDGNGTGFITYSESVSGQDTTHYCRLQKGDTACNPARSFTYPTGPDEGSDSGNWPLLPGGNRVLLLDARCCHVYAEKNLYTSADGGANFGGSVIVGNDNHLGADITGSAIYAPAGALGRPQESLLTIGDEATLGLSFQATGTTGPATSTTSANVITPDDAQSGSLGLQGNTLVAAWAHIDDDTLLWRMWNGTGDVNDQANWTPVAQVDTVNTRLLSRLAYGPSGIYIAYSTGSAPAAKIVVRKFTGSGWGPSQQLSEAGNPGIFDIVEDSAGVLHIAWVDTNGAVEYRSGANSSNTAFTQAQKLLVSQSGVDDPRLAIAPAGNGWLTWDDSNPSHVHALPIVPGFGNGPVFAGPTQTKTTSVPGGGNTQLAFTLPNGCVGAGQKFLANVGTKAKHQVARGKKGALAVLKVIFSFDGLKLKQIKHKPFRILITTPNLPSGGTHTVSAKTTVRVRPGHGKRNKKVTKTLKGKIAIC